MSETEENAILKEDLAQCADANAGLHDEIERLRAAIEDAVDTLEAMDLHIDNPLYDRLRAALEGSSGASVGREQQP